MCRRMQIQFVFNPLWYPPDTRIMYYINIDEKETYILKVRNKHLLQTTKNIYTLNQLFSSIRHAIHFLAPATIFAFPSWICVTKAAELPNRYNIER